MVRKIRKDLYLRKLKSKLTLEFDGMLRRFLVKEPGFAGTQPNKWQIRFRQDLGGTHDVALMWNDGCLSIELQARFTKYLHSSRKEQLFTIIVWMMLAGEDVEYLTFNLSDGEAPSVARFAYSTYRSSVIGLPDPYFFRTRGFQEAKLIGTQAPQWSDRSDDLVWRGAAVGTGWPNPAPEVSDNPTVIPRIRLAQLTKGTDVDIAFVPVNVSNPYWQPILRAGLAGAPIPEETWANHKFAIDIDGITNTWSNLFIRLSYGCCVLKVESQHGYRQWYYDRLKAGEHYIPIKSDLSDFFEQVDWARANPKACAEIAANGRALTQNLTYESESAFAAETILQHWDG